MVINTELQEENLHIGVAQSRQGWRKVRFGDVVRNVQVNVDPDTSGLERYVAGEHMETDNLHIRQWGTIGDGYLGPAFHRKFTKGQVLYGSRRTYLRKVAIAEFDGICANTTFTLEANEDELLPELLSFIMQSEAFTEHSITQSRGSVNPYVNWKDLEWYEFALPPLDEQRRIADILWAADESIEKYCLIVDGIQEAIDIIREEKFGKAEGIRYRLADLCEPKGIQIGPFGSQLHASDYVEKGIPVIMPSDMSNGVVDETSVARITSENAERLSIHKVVAGDILLPRRGDLNKRVLISSNQNGWICGTGSIRIRINNYIPAVAVFNALASPKTVKWIQDNAVGTTMPNLNAQIVSNIPIVLPDKEELDNLVSILKLLEENISFAITHIKAIKRLKKACIMTLLQNDR